MSKKDWMRALIANNADRRPVSALVSAAEKLVTASRNQHNWDMRFNGEEWFCRHAAMAFEGALFDVGANEGQWASMACRAAPSSTIHCFEPVPSVFSSLESALGGQHNVVLNNLGLGTESGTLSLNVNPSVTTVTSKYRLPQDYASLENFSVSVPVTTGEDYCRQAGVSAVALLKVDVEGMELEVLSGFETCLAAGLISSIQFEYGEGYLHAGVRLSDLCSFLEKYDMGIFRLFPRKIVPFTYAAAEDDFRPRNFVAIRRGLSLA